MSTNALQTNSRTKIARHRITGKLKTALDLMIWPDESGHALDYDEAARRMNIAVRSMRKSLERPQVLAYLRTGREVFRATLSTKIPSRLGELAMQDENRNAAVAACRAVLGQDDDRSRAMASESPHVTIRIVGPPVEPMKVVEHVPIEPELGSDPNDPTRECRPALFRDPTRDLDR